jgi:hypothetical protein
VTRFSGWDLGPRAFIGSALLVVGLGLVAAAFTGGRTARGGLIALGVVLSLALITVSTLPWNGIHGGVGDRAFRPATEAEVRQVYRGGVGDMTVDLRQVDVSNLDGEIATRIEHGVGDLYILVPQSADVQLNLESGLGSVNVFDRGSDTAGFFPGAGSASWTNDGQAEFALTVNSGVGDVEVSRG